MVFWHRSATSDQVSLELAYTRGGAFSGKVKHKSLVGVESIFWININHITLGTINSGWGKYVLGCKLCAAGACIALGVVDDGEGVA